MTTDPISPPTGNCAHVFMSVSHGIGTCIYCRQEESVGSIAPSPSTCLRAVIGRLEEGLRENAKGAADAKSEKDYEGCAFYEGERIAIRQALEDIRTTCKDHL